MGGLVRHGEGGVGPVPRAPRSAAGRHAALAAALPRLLRPPARGREAVGRAAVPQPRDGDGCAGPGERGVLALRGGGAVITDSRAGVRRRQAALRQLPQGQSRPGRGAAGERGRDGGVEAGRGGARCCERGYSRQGHGVFEGAAFGFCWRAGDGTARAVPHGLREAVQAAAGGEGGGRVGGVATEGGVERRLPEGLTLQLDFMPVQEWVCGEELRYR